MNLKPDINCNGSADVVAALAFVQERVDEYLDGMLDSDAARLFEHYADRYPECHKELKLAQRIRKTFESMESPQCPDPIVHTVLSRANASMRRSVSWTPRISASWLTGSWWQPALALAAVAIVAIGLLLKPAPPSEFSDAEIEQAVHEVKWTLAYLSGVGKQTGETIRTDIIRDRVVVPINHSISTTFD